MPFLQDSIRVMRRFAPRGWSPILLGFAKLFPRLRTYSAKLGDGQHIYLDLSQRMCHGIFYHRGQPHELGTERILSAVLRQGDTFIDVGANIGFYSLLASRIVGKGGSVIAIEPQPEALRVLRMNAQLMRSKLKIECMAMAEDEGVTAFYIHKLGDRSSMLAASNTKTIVVRTGTLDDVCAQLDHVRLVKIDVEGTEPGVLQGARETLASRRPFVVFELLPELVERGVLSLEWFASYFRKLAYRCFWVSHDPRSHFLSATPGNYVLACPRETPALQAGLAPAFGE